MYLDSSALAKLVIVEPESEALVLWLRRTEHEPVSCDLARTELMRAVRCVAPAAALRVREVLDAMTMMTVSTATFERAALLDPPPLRSLDAIHLAAALELGDDLNVLLTYDQRLAAAAANNGIPVAAPA